VRVLGIDPGSRLCGYGIIDTNGQYITSGTIAVTAGAPLDGRLREIYRDLVDVIREFEPQIASVEKVFFAKSVQSALTLGHARGVALLAASEHGLSVHEYSALEVKKAVTGYGKAEKSQVQEMVKRVLNINTALSPDGADALAIALCHISRIKYSEGTGL
jgi:crossover junction endodeoxyribonuclease RuvC